MPTCKDCGKPYKTSHTRCSKKHVKFIKVVNVVDEVPELPEEKEINEVKKDDKIITLIINRMANIPNNWDEDKTQRMINMLVMSFQADMNNDQFPIDLDDAANILEYSQPRNLWKIITDNFDEKLDYILTADESAVYKKKVEEVTRFKRSYPWTV